jgi:hypothetical protein
LQSDEEIEIATLVKSEANTHASTVGGWTHAEIRKQRQKSVKETHIVESREMKNCVPLVLGKKEKRK